MTKLVPPERRCNIACESRFVGAGIRISEHGYIDAADRCCLRRLTWSDLYRRYSPVVSAAVAGHPCVYTSPPVQGMHACVRVGAPAVSSYASEAERKRNEIPLSINNNPLIQCLLTVTVRKKFESSILRSYHYHVGR